MRFSSCLSALGCSLILSACASIGDHDQGILIRSTPSGASVYHGDKFLGTTPLLSRIQRQHESYLDLKLGNEQKQLELKSKYRWGRSFGGNFALMSLAPLGWGIDFLTGSAWNYDPDYQVGFKDSQAKTVKNGSDAIAIAPPLSQHPNISDDVGTQLSQLFQDKFKGLPVSVEPYPKTLETFNDYDWDFDYQGTEADRYEVYSKLKVNKVFYSSLDTTSDPEHVIVRGKLRDILHPEVDADLEFLLNKTPLSSVHELGWSSRKSDIISWLPNSIYLDGSSSSTTLRIDDQNVSASTSNSNDFIGQVSKYLSAISFRHVTPPSRRPVWRYQFHLVPTASFSYATENFREFQPLHDVTFERIHSDIGWGPSLNYGNNKWNLFFNMIPIVTYDYISANANQRDYREQSFGAGLAAETGVMYFFKNTWNMKLFSRSATVNIDSWKRIIHDIAGSQHRIDSAGFITAGLSLGYTFPNKDLPF